MQQAELERQFPFDKFGRFAQIKNIINANRQKGQRFKVLDIGGRGNLLKKFLPKDTVYYLDPYVGTSDKNFIRGDGCKMPLKDQSFDWVVSADVFEHILPKKRKKFLEENFRVASLGVILAAPFFRKEVEQAEKNAQRDYQALMNGQEHQWLKEHLANGLPRKKEIEEFILKNNCTFQKINNNSLILWRPLVKIHFLVTDYLAREAPQSFKKEFEAFNHFYNTQVFPFDHAPSSYRKIYFIQKASDLKKISLEPETLSGTLALKTLKKAYRLLKKIEQNKRQELIIKKEKIKQLKQTVHERENELLAIKESWRWKISHYLYKIYKQKIKKVIPKFIFRAAAPLTRYLNALKARQQFRKIADPKAIEKLNFRKAKPLNFPISSKPKVSIVIPVFNKWRYTYHCLKTLQKTIRQIPYEVIVVDNNSTDQTPQLFSQKIKNVKYLPSRENLGFVKGCNRGAAAARGQYLVFLNNDTQPLSGWLKALIRTFKKNKKAGLVGSKLIYPDGRLQEAGGIVFKNKNVWNYGRLKNPDSYEFNYLKEVDYCSAAAVMVKKKLFDQLGGFAKRYAPAYFEDTDLAMQVRKAGCQVLYQPRSEIIHFEGVTAGTDVQKGYKKYQGINRKKFFSRWKKIIQKENVRDDEDKIFLARDRSQNKKTALFVDYMVPAHDKEAGLYIAFEYLKILKKLGYKIIFWPDNLAKLEPYTGQLQQIGIETVYGNVPFKDFIAQNGRFIDYAFISRPEVAQKFVPLLKKYSFSKIIYLGHDLHFLRRARENQLKMKTKAGQAGQFLKKEKEEEIAIMRQADLSLFFSPQEIEILRKEAPDIAGKTLPWIQPSNIKRDFDYLSPRQNLLFVGSKHPPNVDGIRWFHKAVWPKVKKKNPQLQVKIAGSGLGQALASLNAPDFEILGFVDDLAPLFFNSQIFIAPLRFGAGIKGKILLAMSYGLPVITTAIGAEGIGLKDEESALIADSPQEFSQKITRLLKDRELWKKISKNSLELLKSNYSRENAEQKLEEILYQIDNE